MCEEMENLCNEAMTRGIAQGIVQGEKRGIEIGREASKKEVVLSLHSMGMPNVMIAQAVKESVSLVEQWIAQDT